MSKISDFLSVKTNFSIKKCYAHHYNNCEGGMTKEHFVPLNGLKELSNILGNKTFNVVGWRNNTISTMHPNNMKSNLLCLRHNNSLGIVDKTFGKFINQINDITNKKKLKSIYTINSNDLGFILLQMGCGYLAMNKINIPLLWLDTLFTNEFPEPKIHIPHNCNISKIEYSDLTLSILNDNKTHLPAGISCKILGIEINTYINSDYIPITLNRYNFNLKGQKYTKSIIFKEN